MKRMGLVDVLRTAARELEMAMHAGPSGGGGRPDSRRFPDLASLRGSPRLEGLRPRPDSREREPLSRPAPLERAPITLSGGVRPRTRFHDTIDASADLGVYVALSEPVEIGDVLVTDPVYPARMKAGCVAADSTVAGVVSGEPRGNNTLAPAILRGIASCKADASYGAIAEGDLLTSSPTRGHAMLSTCRATETILGRALEALPTGRGRIRVLVTRK